MASNGVVTWVLQQFGDYHLIFDVISGVAVVAGSYFGLLIRNSLLKIEIEQGKVKAEVLAEQQNAQAAMHQRQSELLEGQHELQSDFAEKHSENREALAVHVTDDMRQFEGIRDILGRIDRAVEKIANGKTH